MCHCGEKMFAQAREKDDEIIMPVIGSACPGVLLKLHVAVLLQYSVAI